MYFPQDPIHTFENLIHKNKTTGANINKLYLFHSA
jgi:hypothetical protein